MSATRGTRALPSLALSALLSVSAPGGAAADEVLQPWQALWEDAAGEHGRLAGYTLDRALLDRWLDGLSAPGVAAAAAGDAGWEAAIELPVGGDERETFLVREVAVLAPDLAARHPGIRTFAGASREAPERRVRITITSERLHARIFLRHEVLVVVEAGGDVYLAEPESALRPATRRPAVCAATAEGGLAEATGPLAAAAAAADPPPVRVEDLTTYRLAVATTSGFSRANGGTRPSVLGTIVTAVNSVNEIFERDVGARFVLVAETERVIFTDPRDDPFAGAGADGDELLDRSQDVLDCLVGPDRYDVGHTLNTDRHSLAAIRSVGRDGSKGSGATGVEGAGGNNFDIVYLAHELGHQLGAEHTYTGHDGDCRKDTFHPDAAVEPGSGSTLMSYAGLCGVDDLQPTSDAYFHARSIEQILAHRRDGPDCHPAAVAVGNSAPVVDAGPDAVVPAGTSFRLAPHAVNDPDGDRLTHTWEQIDLDGGCCAGTYRSVPPSLTASQFNPGADDSCRDCSLTFAFGVRDNHVAGGGMAIDHKRVHIYGGSGPFVVETPNPTVAGELEVRWQVADTDTSLGVDRVEVLLLCDGAVRTGVETANDGQVALTLPDGTSCETARVEVRPLDGIFHALSEPFGIAGAASGDER